MRSLLWKTLIAGSLALAVGCGDDDGSGGTGASGGSEDGAGGSGAGNDGAGGSGAGDPNGGSGGGGAPPGDCIELDPGRLIVYQADENGGIWFVPLEEELGDAEIMDEFDFGIYPAEGAPPVTGEVDLASGGNENYRTCSSCVNVLEDYSKDGIAKEYFQASGTIDYGDTVSPFISITLTDVTLVEVTYDDELNSTPVPGGSCVHIESYTYTREAPPAEWTTCDTGYYDDGAYCDCNCGAPDPDCEIADAPLAGCLDGQTCSETGLCEGTPTDWDCGDGTYADGATCHCGCGILDPDCADALSTSCENCNAPGSCSTGVCPGTPLINTADNTQCVAP